MHTALFTLYILSLATAVSAIAGIIGRKESLEVTGSLKCHGKPAGDIKVKLYDDNLLIDGFMGESHSNANGFFDVSGYSRSILRISPKLNIYHRCGHIGLCPLKLVMKIPKSYISYSEKPTKVFDIGEIELSTRFKGAQKSDCIN